ncbi:MAG: zinc ABC transporter solute-binding protein [Clostridiaceae bacterium]|nr:zinc ABC transporter solute-binding protein [Clostridiaceae bacterium]
MKNKKLIHNIKRRAKSKYEVNKTGVGGKLTSGLALFLICILLFSSLTSCNANKSGSDDQPLIYASFFPILDLTKTVADGSDIEIKALLPVNQDPHLWEPTPRDIEKLSYADMLIVNGANMEERWLASVRDSLPDLKIVDLSEGVDLITYKGAAALGEFQFLTKIDLEAGHVYPIEFGHTHEEFMRIALIKETPELAASSEKEVIEFFKEIMLDDGEIIEQRSIIEVEDKQVYKMKMGHTSGLVSYRVPEDGTYYFVSDRLAEALLSYRLLDEIDGNDLPQEEILAGSTSSLDKITYDPHSWLSLKNAMHYLNTISNELSAAYPEHAGLFDRNKVGLVSEIRLLEHTYREIFAEKEKKAFVVTHYAYAYLARDFGLKQYPLQNLTSMGSPSLNALRRAVAFCREDNLNTIFYEKSGYKMDAQTIAWEIGGEAVPLTSMEYVSERSGLSYLDIMRENLEEIERSLQ